MYGFILALGPAFPKAGHFTEIADNLDVYNLLAHLLQITPGENDGSWRLVELMMGKNDDNTKQYHHK